MSESVLSPNPCESCGGEVWSKPNKDGTPRKKRLCTYGCRAYTARKYHYPEPIKCMCPNCGTVFKRTASEKKKYCSISCSHRIGYGWRKFERSVSRVKLEVERRNTKWRIVRGIRRKVHLLICAECGGAFESVRPRRNCCSKACSTKRAADAARAKWLRINGWSSATDEYYSAIRRAHGVRRRERRANNGRCERINPIDIFNRDGWRCYICGVYTPKRLRGTYEDRAPEMEHVVPLVAGGTHTQDNVKCSCKLCNRNKGSSIYQEDMFMGIPI